MSCEQIAPIYERERDGGYLICVAKNYSARKVEYLVKSKKTSGSKVKTYDANILRAQEKIEKVLGLKVNILNKKNNSGKIVVEYKDLEQFELISNLLTKN